MLALRNPYEAYRKVDFDARVSCAGPGELVLLCYEQLVDTLGRALYAHEHVDNRLKSESLTRGLSAITALQFGIAGETDVACALRQLYEAARQALLDCALNFDPGTITRIRDDFSELAQALK